MLRQAREEDADAIRDLTREAYSKWISLTGREPLPMQVDYDLAVRDHRFDLALIGGVLAALIETTQSERWLLIENVAVRPDLQGQRLGTLLISHSEDLARIAGLMGVRLYTNRLFTDNLRFYAALGFRVEREEVLNGGVAVHMVKPGAGAE